MHDNRKWECVNYAKTPPPILLFTTTALNRFGQMDYLN